MAMQMPSSRPNLSKDQTEPRSKDQREPRSDPFSKAICDRHGCEREGHQADMMSVSKLQILLSADGRKGRARTRDQTNH